MMKMMMARSRMAICAVVVGLSPIQCGATDTDPDDKDAPPERVEDHRDRWGPLALLEGTWEGRIDGRLGQGRGFRRYQFILSDRYLLMRHDSVRPPQEKSPEGDHHGELTLFSYDSDRATIVLREFMEEGFVLQSVCTTHADGFACNAEAIESGPGMQARLTVTLTDAYRFEERFELAAPGEELQVYFTNIWTRIPDYER